MRFDLDRLKEFCLDCGSVFLEAAIVLLIVHIPLTLSLIYQKVGDDSVSVISAIFDSYQAGDVMGYIAGLLASSTAFFIVRYKLAKFRPLRMMAVTLIPLLIIFFAAPIFFRDIDGAVEYTPFTENYIYLILSSAGFVWIYSLYQQKAIDRLGGDGFSENGRVQSIMDNVHRPDK